MAEEWIKALEEAKANIEAGSAKIKDASQSLRAAADKAPAEEDDDGNPKALLEEMAEDASTYAEDLDEGAEELGNDIDEYKEQYE